MICKKCGANIESNSKFCGVCGEKVEELVQEQNIQSESIVEETPMVVPLIQPEVESLEQTAIVEPVVPEVNVEANENVIPVIEQPLEQTAIVEPVTPVTNVNENVTPTVNTVSKEPKKKSNAWVFVLLGVLLGVVALVLVVFAFNKNSNSDVKVLEKALGNFEEKGENSGTVDVKLLLENDTQDSMNFSGTFKYAKQGDDNYNFDLTLNKSMLFDEINVYASLLNDKLTLFANSSLIDMLGLTSSTPSMWVHYTMTEDELEVMEEDVDLDDTSEYYLRDVLDQKHFKLIDEQNNVKHYQLVIDNELLNKVKAQAPSQEELKEFEDSLADINNGSTELTETYYLDLYINNSNELVKVSMDLSNYLEDETVKKAVLSLEFRNFGTTVVQIPTEAKNSIIDLETYMSRYAIQDDTLVDPTLTPEYTY